MLFSTDNEYDIPTLLLDRQSVAIALPVIAWGSVSRGVTMPGTWVFFVDDSRFMALIRDPLQIIRTSCKAACEPNFSLFEQTPKAEVIWSTYRKRLVARTWQEAGIDIRVDLNVPARHRDLCMLGVPSGWRAFATRGYAARLPELADELAFAQSWGGPSATVLVYGGGRKVEALCHSTPGAVYVPSHMASVQGAP